MSLSMTGCGEAMATVGHNTCRIELRTVNNRFFKLTMRAREGFSLLEPEIEAAIKSRVRRGAVQLTLDVSGPVSLAAKRLDGIQLDAYLDQVQDFCSRHTLPPPQTIDALLGLPGVLAEKQPAGEEILALWPVVSQALAEALDRLDRMRRAEGEAMACDLRSTCAEIAGIVTTIYARVPVVVEEHAARLLDRVNKLLDSAHPTTQQRLGESDLAREIALLADRSDIAEELVRLKSHLSQFDRLLNEESPGRSLDFLTQELAREANTIASKSLDIHIAHAAVELKTRIERLRELIQNIE